MADSVSAWVVWQVVAGGWVYGVASQAAAAAGSASGVAKLRAWAGRAPRRAVPSPRALGHGPLDHPIQPSGRVPAKLPQPPGLLIYLLPNDRQGGFALEGHCPRQHLVSPY